MILRIVILIYVILSYNALKQVCEDTNHIRHLAIQQRVINDWNIFQEG
jgi:hypothetical protein